MSDLLQVVCTGVSLRLGKAQEGFTARDMGFFGVPMYFSVSIKDGMVVVSASPQPGFKDKEFAAPKEGEENG